MKNTLYFGLFPFCFIALKKKTNNNKHKYKVSFIYIFSPLLFCTQISQIRKPSYSYADNDTIAIFSGARTILKL